METTPRHLLIEDQTVPSEMGAERGYEVTRAEGRKDSHLNGHWVSASISAAPGTSTTSCQYHTLILPASREVGVY